MGNTSSNWPTICLQLASCCKPLSLFQATVHTSVHRPNSVHYLRLSTFTPRWAAGAFGSGSEYLFRNRPYFSPSVTAAPLLPLLTSEKPTTFTSAPKWEPVLGHGRSCHHRIGSFPKILNLACLHPPMTHKKVANDDNEDDDHYRLRYAQGTEKIDDSSQFGEPWRMDKFTMQINLLMRFAVFVCVCVCGSIWPWF